MHCVDLGESLSNEYLLAEFGFDTAEDEPLTVHLIIQSWDSIFTEPPRPAGLAALDVSYGICLIFD